MLGICDKSKMKSWYLKDIKSKNKFINFLKFLKRVDYMHILQVDYGMTDQCGMT